MDLVIIASDTASPPPSDNAWILRLAGVPGPDEAVHPELIACADRAAADVRERFPRWLSQWVSESGARTLYEWPGPISWWWYGELSESSPLRSRAIRQIYWLTLVRLVVGRCQPERVTWIADDDGLGPLIEEECRRANVEFKAVAGAGRGTGRLAMAVRLVRFIVRSFARRLLLRAAAKDAPAPAPASPDVLLFTRFPVLWELGGDSWRERMFGTWPGFLSARGHHVGYAAVYTGTTRELLAGRRRLGDARTRGIRFIEAELGLRDWFLAHVPLAFWVRYARWRRERSTERVEYDGRDIRAIWWPEVDRCAFGTEIPFDLTIAAGLRRLLERFDRVEMICHPFEFQPMERAVWIGARTRRPPTVVGVQTGMFTANQMGFTFERAEVRGADADGGRAPLPDLIAAYGRLPHRVFAERLGEARVALTGPIRYPELIAPGAFDRQAFLGAHDLPADRPILLIATSISERESVPMLEAAFRLIAERPEIVPVVKWHYHLPLGDIASRIATRYGVTRFRTFDTHLHPLLRISVAMICAGSSTGIESIRLGCMPLVYRDAAEMSSNAMLEVRDAVFFWSSADELGRALDATLEKTPTYQEKVGRWPEALADQCLVDLPLPDERLYASIGVRSQR